RPTGVVHPNAAKMTEVIHMDYEDYSSVRAHLEGVDMCFFCIGVYTGKVSPSEYRRLTATVPIACGRALRESSPRATFILLSSERADQTQRSRKAFRKYKGEAEAGLLSLGLDSMHFFRPGMIIPAIKRKAPTTAYAITDTLLVPILRLIWTDAVVRSDDLGMVMVRVGIHGRPMPRGTTTPVIHNKEIKSIRRGMQQRVCGKGAGRR
ncbi:hypothetical protein KIPB_001203, partial [Kipferlia bialata]